MFFKDFSWLRIPPIDISYGWVIPMNNADTCSFHASLGSFGATKVLSNVIGCFSTPVTGRLVSFGLGPTVPGLSPNAK